MNRRVFIFLAFAACFWGGCAQDFTPAARPSSRSTLWRVKSPTNTVYLMGSIHVLSRSVYPLKPALERAFRDSQRVVFEIALGQGKTEPAMAESFNAGLFPKGEKLSDHLTPETLTMLKTLLPYFGIPLEKLEPMRPWLVSDLLMSLYLSRNGYQSDYGLDFHFLAKAQKSGKPTSGLEKVKAQTDPFQKFSDAEADQYLRETLSSLPFTTAWFGQMVTAWRNGDVKALDTIINHSSNSESGFYKSIFDDRNNAWMPGIRKFIGSSDNVLIIVGSGHLVGRNGVIEQLQREGYPVEQL